ncbi:hypothetical protein [Paenibacillus larvae]|uniref:Uncharacterized protein n=1 Tax=Paenibacillus larvae subsp. larvae TaxID=147375 RepID=A0A2L1U7I2_9BACL|nr:hypothetical protein [Paenibacillus larvae]AVF28886.1 hypothetical protein ERICIII_04884 [Paenibacillus larvae subsp. larvae]MCY9502913.1 hypothetical protein [Paenibacillus larvae]MDR5608780.1 hypothetical protein [Paenibacillus larvae]
MKKHKIILKSHYLGDNLLSASQRGVKDFKKVLDTLVEIYQPMIDNYEKIEEKVSGELKKTASISAPIPEDDWNIVRIVRIPIKDVAQAFMHVTKDSKPSFASVMSNIIEEQENVYQIIADLRDKQDPMAPKAKHTIEKVQSAFSEGGWMSHAVGAIEHLLQLEDNQERYDRLAAVVLENIPLRKDAYHFTEPPKGGYFVD